MSENKNDIKAALQRMESEAALLQEKKKKIEARIQKHIPKRETKSRDELVNEKTLKVQTQELSELKSQTIFYLLLFITLSFFVYGLTREARTTLIEYIIYLTLISGMVAARIKR
jgi:hypothetical protein